ncbi:MAG: low molecular weight protein arginine phosphatase [Verrucomicrobiota bacterium]
MKHIIFVCTGNICRSPMAEGLLKHELGESSEIQVSSAGIAAGEGMPPSLNSVTAMQDLNIDITDQRSTQLTPELAASADYLFVMTYGHLDAILMMYPEAADKTYLVRHFIEDETLLHRDISDPIGQSEQVYRHCRDEIASAMKSIIAFLKQ